MKKKALIVGISGTELTKKEKIFLRRVKPWGIILFSRNIINILQLKALVSDIKKTINEKNYPVLIDEEGGKVSRINKIVNLKYFSKNTFQNFILKIKRILKSSIPLI